MKREARTLIVDDSRAILQLMDNMLTGYGVSDLTKAGDGFRALDYFQEALLSGKPYALVFLDIVMPVLDGQKVLKRMRAMEKDAGVTGEDKATIVMATSLNSTSDMMDALIEGDCSDYLVKPFDAADLRGVLARQGFADPV